MLMQRDGGNLLRPNDRHRNVQGDNLIRQRGLDYRHNRMMQRPEYTNFLEN